MPLTLSRTCQAIAPSATLKMNALVGEMRDRGEDVISLSVGEPDFITPEHIREAGKRAIDEGKTRYTAASGMPSLRSAIAKYLLEEKGLHPDPQFVERVVALIKERATFVQDFWTIASYLFIAPTEFVPKDVDKFYKPEIFAAALEAMEHSGADTLEAYVRDHGMPMGKVMNCIRLALSGAASGLGIADILGFIGMEEGLRRLRYMQEKVG